MAKSYKKVIKIGMDGNVIEPEKIKSKVRSKVYDDTWQKDYWLRRDRIIYKSADGQTREAIRDRYGV